MSGPFRFTPEPVGSPLDRAASPFAPAQPVSFKTNVNRAKTTKWVQAKKNAYDGDDWGDYDEYDEYGVNQAHDQPARNFTAPPSHAALPTARRNSFERGEEQRAFSSSATPRHGDPQDRLEEHQPRISQVPASLPPTSPVVSPRLRAGSHTDKPLPFIRPADIYKRAQEERLHEQASHDSLSPRPTEDAASPAAAAAKTLPPLETVAERRSDHLPDFGAAVPPADEQGLRSVVDRAFVRNDDSKSVPPTPIAKETATDSDMSRVNTGSTTGISPIMSRVPSAAAAAAAARNPRNPAGEGTTPAIAEETASEVVSPVTLPTTTPGPHAPRHDPPTTSSAHGRNVSASSLPRSGFATPTRGDSPARSSVIAPAHNVPEPITAQIATEGSEFESPDAIEGSFTGPSPTHATQEADMALTQSPTQDIMLRDRSESPSKGRVHALAGKFGDVSHSRRGSTQSNISKKSRNSVQSWENSRDNSRAASPTKASPSKPSSPVKEFRPHLPGQWESYATTANTPLEQEDRASELSSTPKQTSPPLDAVVLTPTTAKRPVAEADTSETSHVPTAVVDDPMTVLKDAGAAMVQSIRTTVGLDDPASDQQPNSHKSQPAHGNIYLPRPLQLERAISAQSSLAPTPSEQNTPESELIPSPLLSDQAPVTSTRQQRPLLDPELSMDPSAGDQESDRLRKEIVASLSPIRSSTIPATDSLRASLQPLASPDNRVSSIFPREYDTYWADADSTSLRPSQDTDTTSAIVPLAVAAAPVTHSEELTKPSMLNRFSWEAKNSPLQLQDEPLPAAVMEPTKASPTPESKPSPIAENIVEEGPQPPSENVSDEYSGAGHVVTVTKPESIVDPKQPNTPPLDATSLASPTREHTRSPGLHVVNTREDPEAVDLPPRFSADQQQTPRFSPEDNIVLSPTPPPPIELSHPAVTSSSEVSKAPTPVPAPAPTAVSHEYTATSSVEKPLGAREIATISSTAERIATYNKTREQWATTDHGLQSWLTCTLHANPELSSQPFPVQRVPTGTLRHRHTSSLALLGKLSGTSHHEPTTPEHHGSSSAQPPAGSASPPSARPSGQGFGGRVAGQHMQLKGEKLLHTANLLGGKGMTSAKGLFAKGKSRFGRDKQVQ